MMKQIPLTQGKFALVDDEDFDRLVAMGKWYIKKDSCNFYAVRTIKINGKRMQLPMHRAILCMKFGGLVVDHIDGDGLNNRKINLRICTHAENMRNVKKPTSNTSGYKGVTFNKRLNKFVAQIGVSGKKIHIGCFENAVSAAVAYNLCAEKYFNSFAAKNSVDATAQHIEKATYAFQKVGSRIKSYTLNQIPNGN